MLFPNCTLPWAGRMQSVMKPQQERDSHARYCHMSHLPRKVTFPFRISVTRLVGTSSCRASSAALIPSSDISSARSARPLPAFALARNEPHVFLHCFQCTRAVETTDETSIRRDPFSSLDHQCVA